MHNRIDVQNDPVNWVDPWGLKWVYSQSTGKLSHFYPKAKNKPVGTEYSGKGKGLNNPAMQNVPYVGPIPQGEWEIGRPRNSKHTGPYVMDLTPKPVTNTYGRNSFQIHGDNSCGCQSASEECIILPRNVRNQIGNSSDKTLEVIP